MKNLDLKSSHSASAEPAHGQGALSSLYCCEGIRFDLTGNCNLRCPYCVNDFSRIHGNTLMTASAFEKGLRLLPLLAPEGELLFSCYFEPTLHPRFLDFLETVPAAYRNAAGFTTNLGKPLGDVFFDRLTSLDLGFVNVSLDSLQKPVFEEMRKGARFETFFQNLDRLAAAIQKIRSRTELRFITVVSKLNLEEISELVATCRQRYRPASHEVRCIWLTEEMESRQWIIDSNLSFEDFASLRRQMASAPSHAKLAYDLPRNPHAYTPFPSRAPVDFETHANSLEDPDLRRLHAAPSSSILLISSDGKVQFLIGEPEVRIDLENLEDSLPVIRETVFLHNLNVGRARLLRARTDEVLRLRRLSVRRSWLTDGELKFLRRADGDIGHMEDVRLFPAADRESRIHVSGWARNPTGDGPACEILVAAGRGRRRRIVASLTPEIERIDVATALQDRRLLYCGWSVDLDLKQLGGRRSESLELAAFALDPDTRRAHPLEGSKRVELPAGQWFSD